MTVAESNKRRTKHGHAVGARGTEERGKHSKVYATWVGLKQRCLNPKSQAYHRYGGRGITVCPEWAADFGLFYAHIGDPPTPAHSIDRIDNNRGYEPNNVRWATRKEQSNNISTNTWIDFDGKRMTWAQWADHLNVPYNLLMTRVKKRLPLDQILAPRVNKKRDELISFNGQSMSLREWAQATGVKYQTLYARIKEGRPLLNGETK